MNQQLTNLAISLEKMLDRLPEVSSNMAKLATRLIIEDLVLHTPVDTGTAISNWQVSLGSPLTEVIPALNPSVKGKTVKGRWQHSIPPDITRQNNISIILIAANNVLDFKQPGQDIFITNNLAYISILNQGSSEQAPAGFVDRARALAQSVVDAGLKLG